MRTKIGFTRLRKKVKVSDKLIIMLNSCYGTNFFTISVSGIAFPHIAYFRIILTFMYFDHPKYILGGLLTGRLFNVRNVRISDLSIGLFSRKFNLSIDPWYSFKVLVGDVEFLTPGWLYVVYRRKTNGYVLKLTFISGIAPN